MRSSGRLLLTVAALLLVVAVASAEDWPKFAGPNADWISTETGINKDWAANPPELLWQFPLKDSGYAGPSVADGMVFIIDHVGSDDIVRALSLETGEELWNYVYADTDKANYGFARSTPTYEDGRVYTLSRLGVLTCLNAADGRLIWGFNICDNFGGKRPQWDFTASPVIDGDKLIVTPGGPGNIVALNKEDGELIWRGGNDEVPSYATPVIATILGTKQYVYTSELAVLPVDAADGKLLWSFPWPTRYGVNAAMPIIDNNFVFITSGYGHGCGVYEITAEGPAERWANKEMSSHFNTPVHSGGYVWGISDPGNLVCLNPQDGRALWKAPGFEKGGVVQVEDVLIAVDGANGFVVMVAMDPSGYQELGRIQPLGGQSWTAPIVADGKLFVRNKDALACLSLK